jgi:aminopeptidase N
VLLGCAGSAPSVEPDLSPHWGRALQHESLDVDLDALDAVATLRFAAGDPERTSLSSTDLDIRSIADEDGADLPFAVVDGVLTFSLPSEAATVQVHYGFRRHDDVAERGGLDEDGATLTWPHHCGRLFPCRSSPAEGAIYELLVRGAPDGQETIFAPTSGAPMPAYALGWSTGTFERLDLGASALGTTVTAWVEPTYSLNAERGLEDLPATLDLLEHWFGPQPFGESVGAVQSGALPPGAMEHAPYWHTHPAAWALDEVHAHEAAHLWFGNSLRIACWEDVVLVEGVVKWLETVIRGQFEGEEWEAERWTELKDRAQEAQAEGDHAVRPAGCGGADASVLLDTITYNKGAWFFHAIEGRIGRDVLLSALGTLYAEHAGRALTTQEAIEALGLSAGEELRDLVPTWLESTGWPGG